MNPYYNYVCIKISSQNLPRTISILKTTFKKYAPGDLFQYTFVDEKLNELYHSEKRMGSIFRYFTALAIVISCLGLLGLASFNTQRRTREIGIRKVLGASTGKITRMFIKDFIKWILLSNMISWPLAWYAISHWLQDFTYKVNLGIVIFVISGILSVFVALITIIFQCLKAASVNPAHSLKQE
jgi:putative ABC transport system permease protein